MSTGIVTHFKSIIMKTIIIICFAITAAFSVAAQKDKNKPPVSTTKQVTYACPMHPDEVSDTAGKCSKCGMALVADKPAGTNKN